METELIERALWAAAVHKAAQAGLGIASGCEVHLKKFIRDGVQRMQGEERSADADYLAYAEANCVAFVANMIIEARQQRSPELREVTFFSARKSLCPLWPFC